MNIAANPAVEAADQTVYLKDYKKPTFLVDSVHLNIQVFQDHTIVDSILNVKRQTEGDFVLLGRDLELKEIKVNDVVLTSDQYQLDTEQLTLTNVPDIAVITTRVIIHPEKIQCLKGYIRQGTYL